MNPERPRNEPAWRARVRSFGCAFRGLALLLRRELHAKVHAAATIGVIALGFVANLSETKWCLVALAIGMVWAAEAFNTAIEIIVDLVSPEFHPLAGMAKDIAAGGVLAAAIAALVIGVIVFF